MDNEPRASMQYLLYVRLGESSSSKLLSLSLFTCSSVGAMVDERDLTELALIGLLRTAWLNG